MKRISCRAIYAALIVLAIGCSGGHDPVSPSDDRTAQSFLNAIEVFGPNTNEDFDPFFHDIALAQVCVAGPTNPGGEYLNQLNHGCIAVTLNREDNHPANPFKPVFRWLDSDNYDTSESPVFYVCQRDVNDPNEPADYRAPACDAIYNPSGSTLVNIQQNSIEVVVAYMVRNRSDWDNYPHWDIEATALQWTGDDVVDYWQKEPTFRIPRYVTGGIPEEPDYSDYDEFNPDVAYNPATADVYVAYTDQEDAGGNYEYINYRKYTRYTNGISGEYLGQTGGEDHNGYDPSIDVGLVTYDLEDLNWVIIAYTSQFQGGHMGFHVNITAWVAGNEWDHGTAPLDVRNPDFENMDAGLLCVDIAPDANALHVAALTYTQVTGSDGFGPTTALFVVRFLGDIADLNTHIPVEDPLTPQFADGLYSSMAINRQVDPDDDITASLAFMA